MFRKIEESLPDKVATKPGNDQPLFTVLPPFATVFDCLRTSARLEIEYRSPGGEPKWRQVDPYHGVRFEGDWYVVGHCHLRGAIRTFSLARMVTARKGRERFALPAHFDFRRLFGSHFGIHWGEGEAEVRIRFAAHAAAYVRERLWHPSQTILEQPDGSLIMTMTVNHLLELKRWILSWGDAAQVLAPIELVNDLRETVQRMAAF
ncbi:WYL domain-containing protein [uncultured Desulfobulbus sp.]|uniref:helix-turn-helix transcriptional regulator n=1 Tax=uncultured Desulfobulbus sp. TaxID=239745 RepID=UPI0029C84447|nr:WYL domain-containing protein [uncultured Desulfobulbus sp.]